jgi:hypothetical protein
MGLLVKMRPRRDERSFSAHKKTWLITGGHHANKHLRQQLEDADTSECVVNANKDRWNWDMLELRLRPAHPQRLRHLTGLHPGGGGVRIPPSAVPARFRPQIRSPDFCKWTQHPLPSRHIPCLILGRWSSARRFGGRIPVQAFFSRGGRKPDSFTDKIINKTIPYRFHFSWMIPSIHPWVAALSRCGCACALLLCRLVPCACAGGGRLEIRNSVIVFAASLNSPCLSRVSIFDCARMRGRNKKRIHMRIDP